MSPPNPALGTERGSIVTTRSGGLIDVQRADRAPLAQALKPEARLMAVQDEAFQAIALETLREDARRAAVERIAPLADEVGRQAGVVEAKAGEASEAATTAIAKAGEIRDAATTAVAKAGEASDAAATAVAKAEEVRGATTTAVAKAGEAGDAAAMAVAKAGEAGDAAATAATKAGEAGDAAATAVTKAGEAGEAAILAVTKAGEIRDAAATAVAKAGEAGDAAAVAVTKAGEIRDAAATAVTKAGEAGEAAILAVTKAGEIRDAAATAATKAGEAGDAAATAVTKAGEVEAAVAGAADRAAAAASQVLVNKVDRAAPSLTGPLVLAPCPLGQLPNAFDGKGAIVAVPDGPNGHSQVQSDGVCWRWVLDGSVAAFCSGAFSFTRASEGYGVEQGGGLVQAPAGVPLAGPSRRVRISGPATNHLANTLGLGAQSGGLPPGWSYLGAMQGVAVSFSGPFLRNNMVVHQIRCVGTAMGTGIGRLYFNGLQSVPASEGQPWHAGLHIALVSGSNSGFSRRLALRSLDAAGGPVGTQVTSGAISPGADLTAGPNGVAGALSGAGIAFVAPCLELQAFASGNVIDATYEISLPIMGPGLEVGAPALSSALAGGPVSRSADVLTAPLSALVPSTAAGTLAFSFVMPRAAAAGQDQTILQLDDGTDANAIRLRNFAGTTNFALEVVKAGVVTAGTAITLYATGQVVRMVLTWDDASAAMQRAGGSYISVNSPPPVTTLRIGSNAAQTSWLNQSFGPLRVLPARVNAAGAAAALAAFIAADTQTDLALPARHVAPGQIDVPGLPLSRSAAVAKGWLDDQLLIGAELIPFKAGFNGAVTLPLRTALSFVRSARLWDVMCDGVADDTAAMDRAISDLQGKVDSGKAAATLLVPGGVCNTQGFTPILGALNIEGEGQSVTEFRPYVGNTRPVFEVACQLGSTDLSANGFPGPTVRLRKFRIFGASGNTDAGLGVAHGVYAHRAAERPLDVFGVVLEEVYIGRIAGRGIYATSGVTLGGRFTRVLNTRGQCLNLNSTNDAQWFGCGFGGGSVQTAVLSGNGQLSFTACNFYASPEDNIYLYEAADAGGSRQTMFYACSIDRARQHGMRYDVQNPRSVVMLIASYFSLNGLLTPNTYSDIYVTAAAASESLIIEGGSQFQLTHADNPAINVKHNIEFATGSTNLVRTNGAKFEGGAGRASISNRKGQLFTENLGLRTFGDGRMSLPSDFPTSAAGLPAGFLYRDGNILRVA